MKTYLATLRFKETGNPAMINDTVIDCFTAKDEDEVIHKAYAAYGHHGDFEIEIETF